MPTSQLSRHLDHVYRLVLDDLSMAVKRGNEIEKLLGDVADESRLPAGLLSGLNEARKHFKDGTAMLVRLTAQHVPVVRAENGVAELPEAPAAIA